MNVPSVSVGSMARPNNTHSVLIGYLCWLIGIFGAHRFYYGKRITGTIWFFTFGLFFIGWLIDLFLIPSMDRQADNKYAEGPINYNAAWVLLAFFGLLGFHRFYMGKWLTGLLWFCTIGLLGMGWLYDLWTLNEQVSEINLKTRM
ncbi:TM2 domain protein [Anatilimnocola aggregata]|uniref:TM2 domain protein n=1 Tax=Anatilimnocola aggregata TaxID=2528021 RepID=A0A517YB69_9BACT|nr:TM2 domain-containing protein [Anatilimnocola aggregata]QDU27503.1 TM2 domain protein [Anatilimnocola aggregata]